MCVRVHIRLCTLALGSKEQASKVIITIIIVLVSVLLLLLINYSLAARALIDEYVRYSEAKHPMAGRLIKNQWRAKDGLK